MDRMCIVKFVDENNCSIMDMVRESELDTYIEEHKNYKLEIEKL